MSLPTKAKVVIIGGGIHGLSTAWKLSEKYKNPNDIILLEKKDTAAGASGIACGVVRNNYYQPAMRELMAMCVDVWESDQKNFHYHKIHYHLVLYGSLIVKFCSDPLYYNFRLFQLFHTYIINIKFS